MKYKHFGVMLDCSRNAVIKVTTLKKLIDVLVKIGYNAIELYTEDTYGVQGEPYFGHMRGRYSAAEIKEIDAYARERGVELIPCVQTLAHLETIFRWEEYEQVLDVEDILQIDNERTYTLIKNIFKTLSENFSSRKVNIGMDEAHLVGLGKYLDKHGFKERFDILLGHLNKVVKIAEKYGFTPHMWSDMFFRLLTGGTYYAKGVSVPEHVRKLVPENVELSYWDYYTNDAELYDEMFRAHSEFDRKIWFAGGAWTWCGYAPINAFCLETMREALRSASKYNIENVMLTLWGDNGGECSFFAALPSLYAIRQYADGNFDEEAIRRGFKQVIGYDYDDFMLLDLPNKAVKEHSCGNAPNAQITKRIMFNDPFLGLWDKCIQNCEGADNIDYAKQLSKASERVGEYAYIFEALSNCCQVLHHKALLGLRTREAYQQKNLAELKKLCNEYQATIESIKVFYSSLKAMWDKENKPFGWETQSLRFGGHLQRLKECKERLEDYVEGKIEQIEELEEPLLDKPARTWKYQHCVPGIL